MSGHEDEAEVSLLLRRAGREYLGLDDGDYFRSDVCDAQAGAVLAWVAARDARVARISENMTQAARHNVANHLLIGFARKLADALSAATEDPS